MDSVKFFELVRNSAYALALCILLPTFADVTARLFIGSVEPSYWQQKNTITSEIPKLRYKESTIAEELAKKPTEQSTIELSEVKKELEELSTKLAIVEEKEKQNGRITFYVAAIVGLLSLLFGFVTSANYLAAGATLGGTLCLVLGYSSNWGQLNDFLKALSLLIAILLLIATSFRMTKREG